MPDEPKKIIVDDDWKAEAKQEKERLASEETPGPHGPMPEPTFPELINIIVMQAMAALGALTGPDGRAMPPQPEVAKHFIDMLQVLDEKTKGNLTEEEKKLLDQVLYETRMAFVQLVGGGAPAPGATPTPPDENA